MWDALVDYFWKVVVSVDQFINVLIAPILNCFFELDYPFGDPDETISSVLGKNQDSSEISRYICNMLDKLDPNHCADDIERDEGNYP